MTVQQMHTDGTEFDMAAIVAQAVQAGIAQYVAAQGPTAVPSQRPATHRIRLRDLAKTALDSYAKPSARTYRPYIRFLVDGWVGHGERFAGYGDRWVDEILPSDLEIALAAAGERAELRIKERNEVRLAAGRELFPTGGKSALYNAVGAWRWLFDYAARNRHLDKKLNPAKDIDKPRRIDGTRIAFTTEQLQQVLGVASGTGDDPILDSLLCETILVTGARQEGLLNLTLGYLNSDECVLWLDEKFGKIVPQPVPDWFFAKVRDFALTRGAKQPGDKVFRKRGTNGQPATPITGRRFDNLFTARLQSSYEWADRERVGAHTVRHHAITLVERRCGTAVAQAFARHSPGNVTSLYTLASQAEVARAVVGLYGGDHPWLHREPRVKPRG